MLDEFVKSNCEELLKRCQAKAAARPVPGVTHVATHMGVSLFLQQFTDALRDDQFPGGPDSSALAENRRQIGRAAALHGAEMWNLGLTIGQVVNEYGDVCQSLMDLAIEKNVTISSDEFRTFNRCLDHAIADAATAFGLARHKSDKDRARSLNLSLDTFSDEHQKLVDIAIQAYFALQTGHAGTFGATGGLLINTLTVLRGFAERNLPGIRLASTATAITPPDYAKIQV